MTKCVELNHTIFFFCNLDVPSDFADGMLIVLFQDHLLWTHRTADSELCEKVDVLIATFFVEYWIQFAETVPADSEGQKWTDDIKYIFKK